MDLDKKMKLAAIEVIAVLHENKLSAGEGLATLAKTLVVASRAQGINDDDIKKNLALTIDIINANKN